MKPCERQLHRTWKVCGGKGRKTGRKGAGRYLCSYCRKMLRGKGANL